MKYFQAASIAAIIIVIGLSGTPIDAGGLTGATPASAMYIDNQPHTISARSSMWFRFDYDADPLTTITVQLVNGANSGMRFDVWTPNVIAHMPDNQPVGHGTAFAVACPEDSGMLSGCYTKNLIWSGAFWKTGSFRIEVVNENDKPVDAVLTVQGAGVFVMPPNIANALADSIMMDRDDPSQATAIDNQEHILDAGAAVWYRFDYRLDPNADGHPPSTLVLNGDRDNVHFEVWTADRLDHWWENNNPVGRGTVVRIDCETGRENGKHDCDSSNFRWVGGFIMNLPVYVRVINDNGFPATFTLTVK